ncbi:glycan biosynthesis hexose transferase WsfD [Humibacter ginsengiterrae]
MATSPEQSSRAEEQLRSGSEVLTEERPGDGGDGRPSTTVGDSPQPPVWRNAWWRHPLLVRIVGWGSAHLMPGPASRRHRHFWLVAALCGVVAAAVLLLRLFVPTVVGMGDQGDGNRLLCELGVGNDEPYDYVKQTQYVFPHWSPHQWYGESCGADGSGEPYYSTQSLLLWPAKLLTPMFGWGNGLDTRVVGILCAIAFGLLVMLFVTQLPGRPGFRILIAAGVTAVMADGVFADFFISPYSEAACFLGVFGTMIALMFLWRRESTDLLGLLLVAVACAFTIGAKTQMVSMLPVVAVALLWRPYRSRHANLDHGGASARRGFVRKLALRIPALLIVLVLAGGTAAYLAGQPKRFTELNTYNAIFVELLPHSPNPVKDLEWFGLDSSFATSTGTTVASADSAVYNPHYAEFLHNVTETKIVLFYLEHPERLISMADRGLDAIAHPELGYIGSYMANSGEPPWAKEHRFSPILGISAFYSTVPLLIVVVQLLTVVLATAVAARRRLGARARAFGLAVVFVVFALWTQFWAVMLSEGASEIYKHMIVATFMTGLCLPAIAALIMLLRRNTRTRDRTETTDAV